MKYFGATYVDKSGNIVSTERVKSLGLDELIEETVTGNFAPAGLWIYAVHAASQQQTENKILYDVWFDS